MPLRRDETEPPASVGGSLGGFNWSLPGLASRNGSDPAEGQPVQLGYGNANVTIRGKWDKRYQTRGGISFGALLDETGHRALGGGFLTNERATELYGQYQFVLPDLDAQSSFTLGEYVTRERQSFATGAKPVWGYTTYLNWSKRNDGRKSKDGDLPPGLRSSLQTLIDNVSAISGTVAFTHSPQVREGIEGAPRTNAVDLSLRGVTPSLFGPFLPVSLGVGVNAAHYGHVDDSRETAVIGNGGLGIVFMGGDYFRHPIHWLVGIGGDADTTGVFGGTVAAELDAMSVSYRQTTDREATLLVAWRVSDLWSEQDQRRISTLNVADGNGPISFSARNRGAGKPDRIAAAEHSLIRMGFLPPTGSETGPSASGSSGGGIQLTPTGAAQQPLQVQQAITRTQQLQQDVQDEKNAEIRSSSPAAANRAVITGLSLENVISWGGANEVWATFTSIANPGLSTFTALCAGSGDTPPVSLTGTQILVDMTGITNTCTDVQVFQDGTSLGSVEGCFIAGTRVVMADGSDKAIEDVRVGDMLKGPDSNPHEVLALHRPLLGGQHLYAINSSRHFVTDGHPFMTRAGWKAMDVEIAERFNPGLVVGPLRIGDILIVDGGEVPIESIAMQAGPADTPLYNFAVSGTRSFFVRENGTAYLVHNK
ncbi:MAG: Hint domain-containing homing endonuclease [Alphaproteobacteria bacterium]